MIAEGLPVVQRLLASPYPIRAVMGVPARCAALATEMSTVDVPIYQVTAATMAAVVGFHLNRGVLATADRAGTSEPETLARHGRRIAVLEGVNDHENLGALFRNAAALGVDAVLLGPRCADPLYRRSVRVSMGHVLQVPFARLEPWPAGLSVLRDAGFSVVALTPAPDALPLARIDPAGRIALLLGAEGPGLSAAALAAADLRARIPISSGVDSLNVATAAALAFHQMRGGGVPG